MTDEEPKGQDMAEAFDAILAKQDEDELLLTDAVEPIPDTTPTRDEHGRFAAKEAAVEPAEEPPEPVEPEAEPTVDAPANMPKEIREAWSELPEGVRHALERREEETHRIATKVDRERQIGRHFDTMVERYKPLIEQEGGTPLAAVADLLETARVLRQGSPEQKIALLNQVATQFGIDMEQAYHNRPDPQMAQANIEIARRDAQIASYQAQDAAVNNATVEQQIVDFRSSHEHFDAVSGEMSRLIDTGLATGLQDAYDHAIYTNETLRSTLIEQDVVKRLADERAKQAATVANARRASVSPSSASGTAKPPGSANLSQIDDMRLAYDEIMARNSG